jgi:hypothetical protein
LSKSISTSIEKVTILGNSESADRRTSKGTVQPYMESKVEAETAGEIDSLKATAVDLIQGDDTDQDTNLPNNQDTDDLEHGDHSNVAVHIKAEASSMHAGVSMAGPSEKASPPPKRGSAATSRAGTRTSRQAARKGSPSTATEGGATISQKGLEIETDPYAIGGEDTPTPAAAAGLGGKAVGPLEGDSAGGGRLPTVKTVPKKTSTKTDAPDSEEKETPMQVRCARSSEILRSTTSPRSRKLLILNVHGTLLDCSLLTEHNPNPSIKTQVELLVGDFFSSHQWLIFFATTFSTSRLPSGVAKV